MLEEVFAQIKKKSAKASPEYIILVVDEDTIKLVSSFCSPYELIESGSIYQIEKLQTTRKRYPMSDVIYFINPANSKSIDRVVKDFPPDEEDEQNYDQYGAVHICFSRTLSHASASKEVLDKIVGQRKLAMKTKTLMDCNIDFQIW